ncbi:ribosome small subunit-dependent GTPase A [Clostridioides difficile]|uniref:ribosome small subunit-dependent GTPase A n=2 Tax=Clostridioides difficile TaxID=1496 RepID=UPI000980092E|nr:ribosome small subunit-dependent GTPase A [Clostridioides difficile]SJS43337.1 Putative ribosome biogenesis GTPase RsgA [Clostridioides difficile]SJS62347.1 Putative ribosome biogenesis GTPase RsgA [Clostridioides difficile]SJT00310.1 Putative ribosome biogenesis GTPase RsgA [Clostridioides difficile]HBF9828524.1 ribosome small subunit-dependent GTPase A [Clostridioides difficile]
MNGMKQINLQDYGLNRNFITQSMEYHDLYLARIISQEKIFYQAVCVNGVLFAEVSGKLRFEATIQSDFPTVGDFVILDRCNNKNGNAIIHHVLHRKSLFVRKAAGKVNEEQVVAANIDIVFLCMSLNKDFNIHRLERYLSLTWESGAIPVVVLTKSDLCDNVYRKLQVVNSIALGVDVVVTSSIEPDGYKQISKYIKPGCTVALLGSSGVGKSSLINCLMGGEFLNTKEIRIDDDKGRHATTRRELFLISGGGIVIDTPGMRELGMWDVSEGLDKSFADIEAYFGKCHFRNCTHTSEPGCAIWEAIAHQELSPKRWESYRRLKTEAVFADNKSEYLAKKEKKFKNISKINKKIRR